MTPPLLALGYLKPLSQKTPSGKDLSKMIGKVFGAILVLAKPRPRYYIVDHPNFKPNIYQV
jgi:hypothetical protein